LKNIIYLFVFLLAFAAISFLLDWVLSKRKEKIKKRGETASLLALVIFMLAAFLLLFGFDGWTSMNWYDRPLRR